MSLANILSSLTTRIATEFNNVRGVLTSVETQSNNTTNEVTSLTNTDLVSSFESGLISAGQPSPTSIDLITPFEQGLQ